AASANLSDDRVAGDLLTDAYVAASFADKNVGTAKPVSVSGISISGADAANYTFNTTAATTADITARALTVSATGANKVYDGTTVATVTLSDDHLLGDDVSDAYSAAAFADKSVGTAKTVSVTGISISGADAANYSLSNSSASTTADITAKPLTVSATGENKGYDGTTVASVTLSDNRVAGDLLTDAYSTASFADKNVGSAKTVSVTGISISGADAANYTANATVSTTADITPKAVSGAFTAADKVYDGTRSATITSRTLTGVLGTDSVSLTGGAALFDTKQIGTNKTVTGTGFTVTGVDAGNYTLASTTLT